MMLPRTVHQNDDHRASCRVTVTAAVTVTVTVTQAVSFPSLLELETGPGGSDAGAGHGASNLQSKHAPACTRASGARRGTLAAYRDTHRDDWE